MGDEEEGGEAGVAWADCVIRGMCTLDTSKQTRRDEFGFLEGICIRIYCNLPVAALPYAVACIPPSDLVYHIYRIPST